MKILVSITNFGMKNVEYAKQLIQEYRSMPFDVDIFVLSDAPKNYGNDVTVLVGLPSKDPWSLPFGHKKLFAENIDRYDVFIYTEDDVLIKMENILAFLRATEQIGDAMLPGFVLYERYPNGKKSYPGVFGSYHWIPGSVRKSGEYIFAKFSNEHSACYILTQAQLRTALASGGFLVPPHSGRYDLICSAGTDPYTQCGFEKVICLSHLQEFELYHVPNVYLNKVGLDEDDYQLQIEALLEIQKKKRSCDELFLTQKTLATSWWDRDYYEPCRDDILRLIPSDAKDILSVGCGWGATETDLINNGRRVVAIPLDSVIGKLAESKGISLCLPDFELAFQELGDSKFDAIVLSEVVQHLSNPIEVLTKLGSLLKVHGVLVGSVPNLCLVRRLTRRLLAKNRKTALISGHFQNTALNMTNTATIKRWLRASGLNPLAVRYENTGTKNPTFKDSKYETLHPLAGLAPYMPGAIAASNIIFSAEWTNESC
ncbi:MAG: class I SAM-dependent methyltransferase [Halobacteriota archaeon]